MKPLTAFRSGFKIAPLLAAMEPDRRTITIEEVPPGLRVLCLHGTHDAVTADDLGQLLKDALSSREGVVVDLTETTFLDSATLHALVSAARLAQLARRHLVLQFGDFQPIRRIFEITQLLGLFESSSTREGALTLARGA
jgi:anti-anti-sigma factor